MLYSVEGAPAGSPPPPRMDISLLWIPATLAAASAQTARNATQRRLIETLGTVGATQVRFLYGLPFAALFLAIVLALSGERPPRPDAGFLAFVVLGAATQILATAMMLAAMRERSFAVVTATTKTEPVHIALFGLAVLGDPLTPMTALAIVVATSGVVLMSLKSGLSELTRAGSRPILLGVVAGAFFGLAATGFRGAILSLDSGSFVLRATTTLVCGLALQTAILVVWLLVFNCAALIGSLREWRSSLFAGFLGALASQFWFIGFALTAAANVRTLALVEVLMAQAVSHRLLSEGTTRRELLGMALIVAGVALLLWTAS
jgi:drug/metabolite transporter (DMT)-like permease